jgi:hypothetical protein
MRLRLIEINEKDEAEIDLTIDFLDTEECTDECGCPLQIVSQELDSIVFAGLDVEEKYFPMIARNYHQAFFGVPPESLQPTGLEPDAEMDNSGSSSTSTDEDSATADDEDSDETVIWHSNDTPVADDDEEVTETAVATPGQVEAVAKQVLTPVRHFMPETRDLF